MQDCSAGHSTSSLQNASASSYRESHPVRDGTSWHSTSVKAACKGAWIAQCSAVQRGDAVPRQIPAQHPGADHPGHWQSAQAGPAAVSRSQTPGLLPHSAHPWRHDRGTHACSTSCSFWFAADQQVTIASQLQDAAAFDGQGLGLTNLQIVLALCGSQIAIHWKHTLQLHECMSACIQTSWAIPFLRHQHHHSVDKT